MKSKGHISRAKSDLDIPQGSNVLSVMPVTEGEVPQQWDAHPGIEEIFDAIDAAPITDFHAQPMQQAAQ